MEASSATPEWHVFNAAEPAASAEQKPHPLHLHIEQCESANVAEQNASQLSKVMSSGTADEQGGPTWQKSHALHLQREQWSL